MAKNIEHSASNDGNNEPNISKMRLIINWVGKLVDELNQEHIQMNTEKYTFGPTKYSFKDPKNLGRKKYIHIRLLRLRTHPYSKVSLTYIWLTLRSRRWKKYFVSRNVWKVIKWNLRLTHYEVRRCFGGIWPGRQKTWMR